MTKVQPISATAPKGTELISIQEAFLGQPRIDFDQLALRVADGLGSKFEQRIALSRNELEAVQDLISPKTREALNLTTREMETLRGEIEALAEKLKIGAPQLSKRLSSPESIDQCINAIMALGEKDFPAAKLISAIAQKPSLLRSVLELGNSVGDELLAETPSSVRDNQRGIDQLHAELSKLPPERKAPPKLGNPNLPRAVLSTSEIEAIRDAAEERSGSAIDEQNHVKLATSALETLRKNPQFKFSQQDISDFLRGDRDSIFFLVRLGELEKRGITGTADSFKAALRTVKEKGTEQSGRLGGALIGHARELDTVNLLIREGYTIEGISQTLMLGSKSREIDIIASKNGTRFLIEVKNSEEAFLKGMQSVQNVSQLAGQIALAEMRGDTLLVVIAEGKAAVRVEEIADYVQKASEQAIQLLKQLSHPVRGQNIAMPTFRFTNQFAR